MPIIRFISLLCSISYILNASILYAQTSLFDEPNRKKYSNSDLELMTEEIAFLYKIKSHNEALNKSDFLLKQDPTNFTALNYKGLILHALETYSLAIDAFQQAISYSKSKLASAYCYLNISAAYQMLQQYEKALNAYQLALALGKGNKDFEKALQNRTTTSLYSQLEEKDQKKRFNYNGILNISPKFDSNVLLEDTNSIGLLEQSKKAGIVLPVQYYQQLQLMLFAPKTSSLTNSIQWNKNLNSQLKTFDFIAIDLGIKQEITAKDNHAFHLAYHAKYFLNYTTSYQSYFLEHRITPNYTLKNWRDIQLGVELPLTYTAYLIDFTSSDQDQNGFKIEPTVTLKHQFYKFKHKGTLSFSLFEAKGILYKYWQVKTTHRFRYALPLWKLNSQLQTTIFYSRYHKTVPLRTDLHVTAAFDVSRSWSIKKTQHFLTNIFFSWTLNQSTHSESDYTKLMVGTGISYLL